ncbi:MAG: hypothetical protein ABJA66_13910, partial [Actinomycetota bacterium]
IKNRLQSNPDERTQTLALLQTLILKCGFDDLLEKLLIARLNESNAENRLQNVRALVQFYRERGNFQRILEILEPEISSENLEFLKTFAQTARLLGNNEKELSALRSIFSVQKQDDEFTNRFLEVIYENNRNEFENPAQNPSAHQLQTINFLLSKKETDLAQTAIQNSLFPPSWKFSRRAEINLRFNNFNENAQADFISALQFAPIGELIKQKPDEQNQLIGNNWFNLSEKYGRWLFSASNMEKSAAFLPAMIENRPKDANEQLKLGIFYLQQKEFSRALEHLRLANEQNPNDKTILPYLGAAFFQIGETDKAADTWSKIIQGDSVTLDDAQLYLETLADFGQADKARKDMRSLILEHLKKFREDSKSEENSNTLISFIQKLSETFSDEKEKTVYFSELCKVSKKDIFLPKILLENSLVNEKDSGLFYEISIEREAGLDNYEHDYDYVSVLEKTWETDEAEQLYDFESDFEIKEPKNEKLDRQHKYLDFLIKQKNFSNAEKLASDIEKSLKGHYARPVWLRLARISIKLQKNNSAETILMMKRFVGIEVSENATAVKLPNLERFNETIKILQTENRIDLILDLQAAFYARMIALEQFDAVNFTTLAKVEFQKGENELGLKLLRLMVNISAKENSEAAQAEIASMSLITKFTDNNNRIGEVETANSLSPTEALKFAADTSTEFGFYAEAASFREKLLTISPEDFVNRIEYARLSAKTKTVDEASKILLELIFDKNSSRKARWLSVLILAEIVGSNEILWQKIFEENKALIEKDAEMSVALEAVANNQTGKTQEAIELLQTNDLTPQTKFLRAVLERNLDQNEKAFSDFSSLSKSNAEIEEVFGFAEDAPIFQQIRLYLKTGQPKAALELAKNCGNLRSKAEIEKGSQDNQNTSTKLLAIRASDLSLNTRRQLLEDLSNAAEQLGDFTQAVEFETTKLGLLANSEDKRDSALRLEILKQKITQKTNLSNSFFVIDEKNVSDF